MKKICFFINNMGYSGGTERVTSVIINQLCNDGFEVHVVNLNGSDEPFFSLNHAVVYSSLSNVSGGGVKNFFKTVLNLRNYLKKHSIATLVDVESMLAIYAVPAVLFLGINHIVWEHFNYHVDLGRKIRRLARHLAALFADNIVTLTERDKHFWLKGACCRAVITAIPNPVSFGVSLNKADITNKVFLSVGRLTDQKGFDLLLESWQEVVKFYPDWKLKIVGSGDKGDSLKSLAFNLGLADSVVLIPATPNIQEHYMNASIYVMSSRFEGFPMVLLEAMHFGLPIVSFDCDTGPRELIEPGITGWLAKPEDINSLSEVMINAINAFGDTDFYSEISFNAVTRARLFSVYSAVGKWKNLL
ncbi:glycosyltransferase family 4 protein [Paraglaciecola polaris]|uniref:Uncharacterized protein n=1 Tax=Paraglaciecola polaris LMG 21857 TaxID=1129793 RepID=K6ZXK7_9ALTE|nr:glycosyltransferase family 4 protein [Paraglaciecola polaris]GAC33483.1 hypothetical protein GPLA_2585 [Paraglaciecola polaris LMG 21857]